MEFNIEYQRRRALMERRPPLKLPSTQPVLSTEEIVALALAPLQKKAKQQYEEMMMGIDRLEAKIDALALIAPLEPPPTESRATQVPASNKTSIVDLPAWAREAASFDASSPFSPSCGPSCPLPYGQCPVGQSPYLSPCSFGLCPFMFKDHRILAAAQAAARPSGVPSRFNSEGADASAYLQYIADRLVDTVRQDSTFAAVLSGQRPTFDFIYSLRFSPRPLDSVGRALVAAYDALPQWDLTQINAILGNKTEEFELVGLPDFEPWEELEREVVTTGERNFAWHGACQWGALGGDDDSMPPLEEASWSAEHSDGYLVVNCDSDEDWDNIGPSPALAGATDDSDSDSEVDDVSVIPADVYADVIPGSLSHTGSAYYSPGVTASPVEVPLSLERSPYTQID